MKRVLHFFIHREPSIAESTDIFTLRYRPCVLPCANSIFNE